MNNNEFRVETDWPKSIHFVDIAFHALTYILVFYDVFKIKSINQSFLIFQVMRMRIVLFEKRSQLTSKCQQMFISCHDIYSI